MKAIYVHIGHSKTGTTTLQSHLFSKHDQISYLGRPYRNIVFDNEIRKLVFQDSTQFDPTGIKSIIDSYRGKIDHKTILISEETLSSEKSVDRGLIAKRVYQIFHPCKILVTIRNQLDIIRSYYTNYDFMIEKFGKPTGGIISFEEWLDYNISHEATGYLSEVKYYDLISLYCKLIGEDNVRILLFEDFVNRKSVFVKQLSAFLEIDGQSAMELIGSEHERKGFSDIEFNYMTFKSKYLNNSLLFRHVFPDNTAKKIVGKLAGKSQKPFLPTTKWEKKLIEIFRKGNQRLMIEFNLNLERYNYPL